MRFSWALSISLFLLSNISICFGSSASLSRIEDAKNPVSTIESAWFFFSHIDRALSSEKSIWKDDDITRFVSKSIPLSDIDYAPDDLISISGASIDQAGRSSFLRREAQWALLKMAWSFERKFAKPLVIVSGYRSAKYQKRLWDLGRCTDTLCAPPGYSEHQLGLAIDIFDASNESDYMTNRNYRDYVSWMKKNAYKYGYTQSYQRGPEIDGYDIEPWHWRYVGKKLATKLYDLDMSYSEYIEFGSMLSFIER
jgi:zinc D-Ala-D-Ala carboxypeptidase